MLMKFRISPNEYQLIGDNSALNEINPMNDENPYDENTPTESNPQRTAIIDREELNELYDGDVPESVVPTDPDEIPEGGTVLQGGELIEADDPQTGDSNGGETNE